MSGVSWIRLGGIGICLSLSLRASAEEPFKVPDLKDAQGYQDLQKILTTRIHESGAAESACDAQAHLATLNDPFLNSATNNRCSGTYDAVFGGGTPAKPKEFNFGISIGYFDFEREGGGTDKYNGIVHYLTQPCAPDDSKQAPEQQIHVACGFKDNVVSNPTGKSDGTSFHVFSKTILFRNSKGLLSPLTIRVPVCNPNTASKDKTVQTNQQNLCEALFARSLKKDDVTTYVGHSGGGFGFHPGQQGEASVQKFFSPEGLKPEPGESAPNFKTVFVSACDSEERFANPKNRLNHPPRTCDIMSSAKSAGYHGNFNFIGTNNHVMNDGSEPLSLLESMGRNRCAREVRSDYQIRQLKFDGVQGDDGAYGNKTADITQKGLYELRMDHFMNPADH